MGDAEERESRLPFGGLAFSDLGFSGLGLGLGTQASAVLLAMAHPPWDLGILAPIALVPWMVGLGRAGPLVGAASGGTLGLIFGLSVSAWIPEALAVRGSSPLPAQIGWILTSLWAGALPWMLLGAVITVLGPLPVAARVAGAAGFVFGLDYLRSAFVLGVPWALLGHTQASVLGVAQLAILGGVPLISAFVLAGNVAVSTAIAKRAEQGPERIWAYALVGGWVGLALLGVQLTEAVHNAASPTRKGEPTRILAVRRPIRYSERWVAATQRTQLERLSYQTQRELAQLSGPAPDLVVWPENSVTTPLGENPELEATLGRALERIDTDLVLGTVERAADAQPLDPRYRSRLLWLSPDGTERDRFDKSVGVPVIEAAPANALERWLRQRFGIPDGARALLPAAEARPLRGGFDLVVALCYEIIFPGRIAERRTPDTRAIVNPSSDAWLRDPAAVGSQLSAYGMFRALEQRLTLVRIADAGPSMWFDRFGRVGSTIPARQSGGVLVETWASEGPYPIEQLALLLLVVLSSGAGGLASRVRWPRQAPDPSPRLYVGRR